MKDSPNYFKCSGREIPEGAGDYIGIASDLSLGVGYDNMLGIGKYCEYDSWTDLSKEETLELIDIAMARWRKLRSRVRSWDGAGYLEIE